MTTDRQRVILNAVQSYVPMEQGEESLVRTITRFVASHANPYCRLIREAHVTASAFVLNRDLQLLLTRHKKLKCWLQIGGHGEDETSPFDVAVRELREETGISNATSALLPPQVGGMQGLIDIDVHTIPRSGSSLEHKHFDLRYLLLWPGKPGGVKAQQSESDELRWFPLNEAELQIHEGGKRAVRKIMALPASALAHCPTTEDLRAHNT